MNRPNEVNSDDQLDLIVAITPEPNDEERSALIAALAVFAANGPTQAPIPSSELTPSPWACAGRNAAHSARALRAANRTR